MNKALKCIFVFAVTAAVLCCGAALADEGGIDGSITWTLNDAGVLTIGGEGPIPDYSMDSPWYPYRESVRSVVFDGQVTRIGEYAFYGCTSLTDITIPAFLKILFM